MMLCRIPAHAEVLNPLAELMPESKKAAAPPWLQEGVRVTYYAASAAITANSDELGPAGGGFMQSDVVAVEGDNVALASTIFLGQSNGVSLPVRSSASVCLKGIGDFWINPDVRKDL